MKRMNEIWNLLSVSIIMCIAGSFARDWNLSKSVYFLGWLLLHIETKVKNKAKTKQRQVFATSCRHFSLVKLSQVRYIIKKQTRAKMSYE